MTTITHPSGARRAYRPHGLDRLIIRLGLRLAVWGSRRAEIRAVRNALYREQTRHYDQVRDRLARTGIGQLR